MAAMLRGLVADIADELIAALPPILGAQSRTGPRHRYRRLRNAGLLEHHGVVALLLRRADEQQLSRERPPRRPTVAALVADENGDVAGAAMALTLARGRRRDRFGRLGAEFDDLAAEDAVSMVHAVAAALREDWTETRMCRWRPLRRRFCRATTKDAGWKQPRRARPGTEDIGPRGRCHGPATDPGR